MVITNNIFKIFTITIILLLVFSVSSNQGLAKTTDSPRKQLEQGIAAKDIICKPDLVLVFFKNFPACLKSSTVSKLEKRGLVSTTIPDTIKQEKPIQEKPQTEVSKGSTIQGSTGKPETHIDVIPASRGAVMNFYIDDNDLNISPNGIDIVSTKGLLEFTINGVPIEGPDTMRETAKNTGKFFAKLFLPDTVGGRPLNQDDILEIRYLDPTGASGDKIITEKSVPLTSTFAKVQTSGSSNRIGHPFVVRIYEPDFNIDSKDVDRIPLSSFKYEGEGGIKTTLANPVFDANSSYLIETGENTGVFEVTIEIPRTIDGKTVNIGDWYEIIYLDTSTPSETSEEIKLRGKIG